jgi:hypothetical protein
LKQIDLLWLVQIYLANLEVLSFFDVSMNFSFMPFRYLTSNLK